MRVLEIPRPISVPRAMRKGKGGRQGSRRRETIGDRRVKTRYPASTGSGSINSVEPKRNLVAVGPRRCRNSAITGDLSISWPTIVPRVRFIGRRTRFRNRLSRYPCDFPPENSIHRRQPRSTCSETLVSMIRFIVESFFDGISGVLEEITRA